MKAEARPARGTLTMDRCGDFVVRTSGENHCGVVERLTVKYHLIVECAATTDERGFLFDQLDG